MGYTLEIQVPKNKGNISLLAALVPGRPVESYRIKRGPIASDDIVMWMNNGLFPLCEREFAGRLVVIGMDWLCRTWVWVPEDSALLPQTNPIERMFSQVKSFVSRRTKENSPNTGRDWKCYIREHNQLS